MIGVGLVYGSGAALALLLQVFLARTMGAVEYGTYYYAMSWILVLAPFARLGVDFAVLRHVPVYHAGHDWPAIRGILVFGRNTVFAGSGVAVLAILLMIYFFPDLFSPAVRTTLALATPVLPLYGLILLRQALLRSFQHPVAGFFPDMIVMPVLTLLFGYVILISGAPSTAPSLMAATIFAMLLSASIGYRLQANLLPADIRTSTPRMELRPWFTMSLSMLLINGLYLAISNLDAVILGFFRPPEEVGIYGVASKAAYVVVFPTTIAIAILAPMVARFHSAGEHYDLQRSINRIMLPTALGALLIGGLIVFFGQPVLALFGQDFTGGWPVLVILTAGYVISGLFGPAGIVLTLTGQIRATATVFVCVTIANVAMNLLLIPAYGKEGAAVATSLTMVLLTAALLVLARFRLGLDSTGFLKTERFAPQKNLP
jgi:O-antigen/teichoic acid export membrane protein